MVDALQEPHTSTITPAVSQLHTLSSVPTQSPGKCTGVQHRRGALARSCRPTSHTSQARHISHIMPLWPGINVAPEVPRYPHLASYTVSKTSRFIFIAISNQVYAIWRANKQKAPANLRYPCNIPCKYPKIPSLYQRNASCLVVTREDLPRERLLTREGWSGTRARHRWSGSSRPGSRSRARC